METSLIKFAISSEFFDAFARIPRAQQSKVTRFIDLFKRNPGSPGIHYEKIQEARDKNLYSVRIDQTYRGIVSRPGQGNVVLLLWVDHHDRAYQWARNRVCRINIETGSIQLFKVGSEASDGVPEAEEPPGLGLFHHFRDRQLLKLGIPGEFLPQVRQIENEEQLEHLDSTLPQEAWEALYMLAAGYTEEEVYMELDISARETPVDPEDYQTALENDDSRRRFYVVEDELELQAILNAPLEKWRVFLHPSQRRLVERDWNGPVRVLGGAGTGKTVAALHRAKWLAENSITNPKDKILFTTFTRNLAADIRENLKKICTVEILKRIEVKNLDQWVIDYLRQNNYHYEIDYGKKTRKLWEKAMTLAPTDTGLRDFFFTEEWERVIKARGIMTLDQYLHTPRIGRGTRISRKLKNQIWPVFEEYRLLLNEQGLKEREDAFRDAAHILEQKKGEPHYCAIVVDEAQDMGPQAFRLIRNIIPQEQTNDIFIVGDPHQRIYKSRAVLSHCGINIRGRSRRLRINYRTTEETRKWAVSILNNLDVDDLNMGTDHQKAYKSLIHGNPPQIKSFESFAEEINFISIYTSSLSKENQKLFNTCLVVRTNKLLEQYKKALEDNGIEVYKIKRSEAENRNKTGLRIATMHRVKGLEFDHVILAAINDGMVPLQSKHILSNDPIIQKEHEQIERSLLYVSSTRARKGVLITSYGNPSGFIRI